MRSIPKLVLSTAAAIAVAVLPTHAMFRFDCFNNVVVDRTDPIINYGQPSMHLHMISGGNGYSMTADGNTMLNSTCTSCPIGADLSAYWVPTLHVKFKNGTGFGLVKGHQIVYYQPRGSSDEKVIAFPPGLKMFAGDPALRKGSDDITQRAVTWVCLDYKNNNPVPEQQGIPNARCPNGLRGQVIFPMCWNGKDLDSPDHKSHVAYAEELDGGKCPPGYKKIMKLLYEAFYRVDEWDSEWVGNQHPFVLSNGDTTGFGFHGDFLDGWDENVLQAAIDQCSDRNYFNSGECPPLRATYSDKPPATRCTREPQVREAIDNIPKLPGYNPTTTADSTQPPEEGNEGEDDEDDATTPSPAPAPATTKPPPTTDAPKPTPVNDAPKPTTDASNPVTEKPSAPATTALPADKPAAPDASFKCKAKRV